MKGDTPFTTRLVDFLVVVLTVVAVLAVIYLIGTGAPKLFGNANPDVLERFLNGITWIAMVAGGALASVVGLYLIGITLFGLGKGISWMFNRVRGSGELGKEQGNE